MILSPKQLQTFRQARGRFNLAHGSVRSGKTVGVELYAWPAYVRTAPKGDLLMAGRTLKALERNVLRPLLAQYGARRFSYSLGKKEATLFGRRIELEGANDAQAEAKIRGMTLAGALLNEVTLYPEGFVRETFNRMSVPGAQAFATTNPDSPFHYLKVDFIDREEELRAAGFDVRVWHFTLDDNPFLDPAYVASIKAAHSGLWYKRFVLGLWVQAAGAVYGQFDEDHHVGAPLFLGRPDRSVVGVDYGTANPTAFVQIDGKTGPDGIARFHVPRELYHDGRADGQRTDAQHADALADFVAPIARYAGGTEPEVYVDPSAASFSAELRARGVRVVPADNAVLDGIRTVSTLLGDPAEGVIPRLTVSPDCVHLTREFSAYVWDERAQKRGEDAPAKAHDHALDALRYGLRGLVPLLSADEDFAVYKR